MSASASFLSARWVGSPLHDTESASAPSPADRSAASRSDPADAAAARATGTSRSGSIAGSGTEIEATPRRPLVAALDADIARSIGHVLSELGERGIVVLDRLDLADLEYVDIGRPLPPAGSVPVVVKTLLL